MAFDSTNCWICGEPATKTPDGGRDITRVSCNYCGNYTISNTLDACEDYLDNGQRWKLRCATRIRHNQGESVYLDTGNYLEYIENTFFPKNPIELVDELLKYLYHKNSDIGGVTTYNATIDFPSIPVKSANQFHKITQYAGELGYIKFPANQQMEITLDGWSRLDEVKRTGIDSNKAFVAMWFDDSLAEVWENGLKICITECGYDPIRIDQTNYNEGVCDEIIAQIRNARFIVADLTGNNQGVYYEAGFAHGLGKPVIFTCKKSYFEDPKVHFDVRHYNFVLWENAEELKTRLMNRINATIVKGSGCL